MTTQEIEQHYYDTLLSKVKEIVASEDSDRGKFAKITRISNTLSGDLATALLDYGNFQDLDLSEYEKHDSALEWHPSNKQGFFQTGEIHSGE